MKYPRQLYTVKSPPTAIGRGGRLAALFQDYTHA